MNAIGKVLLNICAMSAINVKMIRNNVYNITADYTSFLQNVCVAIRLAWLFTQAFYVVKYDIPYVLDIICQTEAPDLFTQLFWFEEKKL